MISFSTRLINSIKHEHSCKILWITKFIWWSIYLYFLSLYGDFCRRLDSSIELLKASLQRGQLHITRLHWLHEDMFIQEGHQNNPVMVANRATVMSEIKKVSQDLQWFIHNFGLMGPGTCSHIQTYESRILFLMTSLQYWILLHPGTRWNKNFASQRQNYAQKMQDAQVTKSLDLHAQNPWNAIWMAIVWWCGAGKDPGFLDRGFKFTRGGGVWFVNFTWLLFFSRFFWKLHENEIILSQRGVWVKHLWILHWCGSVFKYQKSWASPVDYLMCSRNIVGMAKYKPDQSAFFFDYMYYYYFAKLYLMRCFCLNSSLKFRIVCTFYF